MVDDCSKYPRLLRNLLLTVTRQKHRWLTGKVGSASLSARSRLPTLFEGPPGTVHSSVAPPEKKTLTWSKTQTDEGKLGFNSARSSAIVQFRSRLWRRKCIEEFNLKCFKAKRRKCVEEFDLKCSKLDEKMSVGVSMKLKFRSLLGETKVKRRTGQKFRRSARLARSRPDEGGPD